VLRWDRSAVAPEDAQAGQAWLDRASPDAIAHLGFGPVDWAGRLAGWAAAHGRPMLFTSTAMVFDHQPDGPHAPGDARNARDDYGRYKIACEDAVRAAHPDACIARLGWQIGAAPDGSAQGNNMLAALDAEQARDGCVRASTVWRPACSFLPDTAAALLALLQQRSGGTVHLDSNVDDAWSFAVLVERLRRHYRRTHWQVHTHQDYRHDQRLLPAPGQPLMPALSRRLSDADGRGAPGEPPGAWAG
jgi:dTDP-4-dehydrorhamnose reductase